MESQPRPQATPEGPAERTRAVRRGGFQLPCSPATALPLFTPEGERLWVDDWHPEYLSGASDEVGAVWRTSHGEDTTWITTDRDEDRVRYARISSNGTAGLVEVVCTSAGGGTRVEVTYDLTAYAAPGIDALKRFATDFDDMLEHWQHALARTPVAGQAEDHRARDR